MRYSWPDVRSSIFSKLALAFLAVITPLYLLGAYINDGGKRIIDKEISKSLQQQVRFYLMSLETEIQRMTVLQREFMNDEDLETLAMLPERMSTYERLSAMKRLQAKLGLFKESSMYIAEASVYIPSVARIITNRSIGLLSPSDMDGLKRQMLHAEPPFVRQDDKLYIREYYPSSYNLDVGNPRFVLQLEISVPELHRFLEQLSGYERGGAALIYDGTVYVSARHADSFERIRAELYREMSLGGAGPAQTDIRTIRLTHQGERYMTVDLYSPSLSSHIVAYVPEMEVMGPIQRYRTFMWLISGFALLIVFIFAFWIYRVIHRPLRKLVGAFRKVESGMMQIGISHSSNDEFRYLYERFNAMVAHLNKLIYEVYEQRIHLQRSELKQLQSQINPHFLYNSFYLLYRMVRAYDNDNASRFALYLGDYYQYITRSGKEEVRLEEELNHVRSYIEIQSMRFHDRIQVSLEEIPERWRSLAVPRLLLQPIVENAYQHGFSLEESGCLLRIGLREMSLPDRNPALVIEVEDNGAGLTEEELYRWKRRFAGELADREVTGILNVHRRLRLRYGAQAGIELVRGADGAGLKVMLILPIESTAETESKD